MAPPITMPMTIEKATAPVSRASVTTMCILSESSRSFVAESTLIGAGMM